MTDNSQVLEPKTHMRVVASVVLPIALTYIAFCPPAVAVLSMICGLFGLILILNFFYETDVWLPRELAGLSILLLLSFVCALIWPLYGNAPFRDVASSLKFLGFFCAFIFGAATVSSTRDLRRAAGFIFFSIFVYHFVSKKLGFSGFLFFPTDQNTTMILSVILLPIFLIGRSFFWRIGMILLWYYYADILASRTMLLMTPVLLIPGRCFLRLRFIVPIATIAILIIVQNVKVDMENSYIYLFDFKQYMKFSERVRLDVYASAFEIWGANFAAYVPQGETQFLDKINEQMTPYVKIKFLAKNTHNLVIEIISMFGFPAAVSFVGFFLGLLVICYGFALFRVLIPSLLLVTLIEPGINDSRVFLLILVFFGLLARRYFENSWGKENHA